MSFRFFILFVEEAMSSRDRLGLDFEPKNHGDVLLLGENGPDVGVCLSSRQLTMSRRWGNDVPKNEPSTSGDFFLGT
jgi:hypothetical protein